MKNEKVGEFEFWADLGEGKGWGVGLKKICNQPIFYRNGLDRI